jgi:hypothetical protein
MNAKAILNRLNSYQEPSDAEKDETRSVYRAFLLLPAPMRNRAQARLARAMCRVRLKVDALRLTGGSDAQMFTLQSGFLSELVRLHLRDGVPPIVPIPRVAREALGIEGTSDAIAHKIDRRLEAAVGRGAPAFVANRQGLMKKSDFLDRPPRPIQEPTEGPHPEPQAPVAESFDLKRALRLLIGKRGVTSDQIDEANRGLLSLVRRHEHNLLDDQRRRLELYLRETRRSRSCTTSSRSSASS